MAGPAASLDDFFTAEKGSGYIFTDIDCLDVSSHLSAYGYTDWAKIPRVYIVLRLLNKVDAIDDFLRLGLNDMCLPFQRATQLPKSLGSLREDFIDRQTSVLTTALALEKGLAHGNHVRIPDTAVFPYESLGPLGQGRYGVDQVRSPLSGELFARKLFKRSHVNKTVQQEFLNELNVLKRIDHEHCVRLVASYTDRRHFGLLISPVAECNLTEFLDRAEKHEDDRNTMSTLFGCLAAAINYLHLSKIRHRDIKPDNVLVRRGTVYLTDFGLSLDWEHLSRSTTTEESGKTLVYCAPEVAEQSQKRNSATDIWSLGCVFFEMLVVRHGYGIEQLKGAFQNHSGSRIFHRNAAVIEEWCHMNVQEPRPSGTGRSLSQLTLEMLAQSPKDRPSARSIYHIISTFQSRNAMTGNPYCRNCCLADPEQDAEDFGNSSKDLEVMESLVPPQLAPWRMSQPRTITPEPSLRYSRRLQPSIVSQADSATSHPRSNRTRRHQIPPSSSRSTFLEASVANSRVANETRPFAVSGVRETVIGNSLLSTIPIDKEGASNGELVQNLQRITPDWLDSALEFEGLCPEIIGHSKSAFGDIIYSDDSIKFRTVQVAVQLRPEPFELEDQYKVAHAYVPGIGNQFVVKSLNNYKSTEHLFEDMRMQALSKAFALEFNSLVRSDQWIDFRVKVCLRRFDQVSSRSQYLLLEPRWFGEHIIYNSYNMYVRTDTAEDHVNRSAQAFTHFTFERSEGQFMVVMLQGVDNLFTDPTIHSKDPHHFKFNGLNFGEDGFNRFFDAHLCNNVCQQLGLSSNGDITQSRIGLFQVPWDTYESTIWCSNKFCQSTVRLRGSRSSSEFPGYFWCEKCWRKLQRPPVRRVCAGAGKVHNYNVCEFFYASQGRLAPRKCPEHYEDNAADSSTAGRVGISH